MRFNQDITLFLNTQAKRRIAEFFLENNPVVSEREVGKLLNIPSMTTHRILKQFENLNFIKVSRIGQANAWKVNSDSFASLIFKQVLDSHNSILSPLEKLKEILKNYLNINEVKQVILYGSIAFSKEKENSDIDIFVLVKKQADKEKVEEIIEQITNKCLDLFGNRLESYIVTENDFKNLNNKNLKNSIQKGIEILNNG